MCYLPLPPTAQETRGLGCGLFPKMEHFKSLTRTGLRDFFRKYTHGHSGASSFQAWQFLLLAFAMPQPAGASLLPMQPDGYHVYFDIFYASNNSLNCSLRTDCERFLCYGEKDAVPCKAMNNSSAGELLELLKSFCEQQKKDLDANLLSLNKKYNQSGPLQLNLGCELEKQNWNVTNVTIRYIYNGKELAKEDASNLPFPISYVDVNVGPIEFMVQSQSGVKNLCDKFKDGLLPFLNCSHTPETTTAPPTATTTAPPTETTTAPPTATTTAPPTETTTAPPTETTTAPPTETTTSLSTNAKILITVVILSLFAIAILLAVGYFTTSFGKNTYKIICRQFSRLACRGAAQPEPEAEGDPKVMEAPEREALVTQSV